MNAKQRPHTTGQCGILSAHTHEDHKAADLLRGVVRGRVQEPSTGRWYKDGFAPFQLGAATVWVWDDEVEPKCDICGEPQDIPDWARLDWNGETGCHLSCENRP